MNLNPLDSPIETLMGDPEVTEIMVNDFEHIFYEKGGRIKLSSLKFHDKNSYLSFIKELIHKNGHSEKDSYYFDGALSGKFRFNIVMPPMNPIGPVLTIRKFAVNMFDLSTMVSLGTITDKVALFLSYIVKAKMNVIVSGGTGSGKTTFLQALSSEIPGHERIVTVEDVPELKLHQKNWVQLNSVHEEKRSVTIKDCLINSLRMRPDRILVGECRRDETFEMLQAMNTGHEGSMTTIHANNPVDCLTRMENLLYASGFEIENIYLRKQIAESIDFIIQLGRLPSGKRVVTSILELTGTEGDVITRNDIFQREKSLQLLPTGIVPKNAQHIESRLGQKFPPGFFMRPTQKL
ncbi:MAG: CpaF family protein [Bdellovibrionales bacterium]|nr:CpaF family protein [Bdellovibrionales bacterium]